MTMLRRVSTVMFVVVMSCVGVAVVAPPALATCTKYSPQPCPAQTTTDPKPKGDLSSGNENAQINTGSTSCSVYANGGGMGMYCVSLGGGNTKTLRERYGDQTVQQCRYSELPPTVQAPFNANPDRGRYMLMTCLGNIDFDTYSGGPRRTVAISIVFVENGTEIADFHNEITDFLWRQLDDDALMPVPFMVTRPNVTPLVGIPNYFTFRWLDPASKTVVAQGEYADRANGGPFRRIQRGNVVMEARATKIVIDPRQTDMKSVTCEPDASYREGASPKNQPANACSLTFKRSSASARKYANREIPGSIADAFYADVTVTWRVTYGPEGGDMQTLGNDFTMRMRQVLPVQEVQAPNQPPAVIY